MLSPGEEGFPAATGAAWLATMRGDPTHRPHSPGCAWRSDNEYRGHSRIGSAVPVVIHRGEAWRKPEKSAKTVPINFEHRFFPDTRTTTYRLAAWCQAGVAGLGMDRVREA